MPEEKKPVNPVVVAPVETTKAEPFSADQVTFLSNMVAESMRSAMAGMGNGGPPKLGAGGDLGSSGDGHLLGLALNPNRPDTPNNDFIHGVKGKITIGGATFFIEQISVDDSIDTDDITNNSSNGGRIMLDGIQGITGTITFVWDSLNVFLIPTNPFRPRSYAAMIVYPDGVTLGATFTALMSGYSYGTGPKAGTVRVQCKYMSSGAIVYPTASATTPTPALTS